MASWLQDDCITSGLKFKLQLRKKQQGRRHRRDAFSADWCLLEKSQTLAPELPLRPLTFPPVVNLPLILLHLIPSLCVFTSFLLCVSQLPGPVLPMRIVALEGATGLVSCSTGAHSAHTHCQEAGMAPH